MEGKPIANLDPDLSDDAVEHVLMRMHAQYLQVTVIQAHHGCEGGVG